MANVLSKITSSVTFLLGLFLVCTTVIFYLLAGEAIKAAAPVVIWSMVGAVIIGSLVRLWFLFDAHRLENKAIRAETANTIVQETLASQRSAFELWRDKMLAGEAVKQLAAGLVHSEQLSDKPTFRAFGSSIAKQAEKVLPGQMADGNLLDAITSLDNLLIVGGKGSGKTSLMQWLESIRQDSGRTVILDSHAQPAQWGGYVVGQGRQYTDIRNAMIDLLGTLDQRYEKYSAGQSNFEPVNQFIDEFTLLPGTLKRIGYNVQDYSIPMLTEGRKVFFNCIWGIHSDRAKPLGLEGMSDLKECFDAIVHLIHNKETGERYAYIDYGEGKTETRYAHPGPFVAQPKQAALQPKQPQIATDEQPRQTIIGLPVASESVQPDSIEKAVVETWNDTRNQSQCYRVYHKLTHGENFTGSVNGDKLKVIKAILATWEVDGF